MYEDENEPNLFENQIVKEIVYRAKGLFMGLGTGFYGDGAILAEERCFDETTITTLESMVFGWYHLNVGDAIITTFTSLLNFSTQTYMFCNPVPLLYDFYTFCYVHHCYNVLNLFANMGENLNSVASNGMQLLDAFKNLLTAQASGK